MSRLQVIEKSDAEKLIDELNRDLEHRVAAGQYGACPVDFIASFVKFCHAQSCGKCVPCRVGLLRLSELINSVLDGEADEQTLEDIENTARSIYYSADCAIGFEAAKMALKGIRGFRDDFEEHIHNHRCANTDHGIPCVSQCPAHVDIPGYIALVHEGRYADAVNLIRKTNPLPATCGLICEHPCEAQCRRSFVDDAINIRGLKRFAVEHEGEIKLPEPMEDTGKSIGVVGGGPAGLTTAYFLRLMGHSVTIYEQRKMLGGMLRYGIPAYRYPREILNQEIQAILDLGIEVKREISVGKDITFDELRASHDAIYLPIGAHAGKKLGIEGDDAKGVVSAVTLLRDIGDEEAPDFTGMDIVVVGGGNVAMDVARSAVRLGAKTVKIVYRRRRKDMPAQTIEIEGAVADGCQLLELKAPSRIETDADGNAVALWVKPQMVSEIKKGRPTVIPTKAEEERIACDQVLVAIGQDIDAMAFNEIGLPLTKKGTFEVDNTTHISYMPGVFTGGDAVTGPATVIRAIAGGKVAAANIDEYLGFHHVLPNDIEIPPVRLVDRAPWGRVDMLERPAPESIHDFNIVEYCMTEEEAHQESGRCLHCDHFGMGKLRGGRVRTW